MADKNQALAAVAQLIMQHASTGPSDTPGQKVRNTLSPHMERFITEVIRAHLIKEAHQLQKDIGAELDGLHAIMPETWQRHLQLSQSRINAFVTSLYK